MNQSYTRAERDHIEAIKHLPCSVCNAPGPSSAHHIDQSCAYTCVALCQECHTGKGGIHREKTMWKIYKLDEIKALNITLRRLLHGN